MGSGGDHRDRLPTLSSCLGPSGHLSHGLWSPQSTRSGAPSSRGSAIFLELSSLPGSRKWGIRSSLLRRREGHCSWPGSQGESSHPSTSDAGAEQLDRFVPVPGTAGGVWERAFVQRKWRGCRTLLPGSGGPGVARIQSQGNGPHQSTYYRVFRLPGPDSVPQLLLLICSEPGPAIPVCSLCQQQNTPAGMLLPCSESQTFCRDMDRRLKSQESPPTGS